MVRKPAVLLLALLLVSGSAAAGTVTLQGTCVAGTANSTNFTFSISNVGNDTAYQLILSPVIFGAQPENATYTVGSLGPGATYNLSVTVGNVIEPGTHGVYFNTVYQQGQTIFTTIFPCLVPLIRQTSSQLILTTNASLQSDGTGVVSTAVHNAGPTAIAANVSIALPPGFTYSGPGSYEVPLAPFANGNVTFHVGFPAQYSASYVASTFASYSSGSLLYTTFSPFLIATAAASASSQLSYTLVLYVVAGAAVLAVAVLILLSVVRKRKRA
ncbi:MAG: hypothetical protein KGI04_02340 [Candidatus Micrarchaeota archaeon]|nr:hypothetical protein [Candidatus Micrarchaeota archaeon]